MSCSMVSRSSSISKKAAARIYTTPSDKRRLIDLYGFFGSMPVGFNHPHFDEPEVQRDLLRAAKVKIANSDVYSRGLRGICRNVRARRWSAAAGALSFHRRRRACGRELLEGGDGLESAQEHGCWSRRARHRRSCIFVTHFTDAAVTP